MGIAITLAQHLAERGVPYDLVEHPHTGPPKLEPPLASLAELATSLVDDANLVVG